MPQINKIIRNKKKLLTLPIIIFLLAFLCAMLWGSSFPIVKYGFTILDIQNNTAAKLYFASYRFFIAGLIVFLSLIIFKKPLFLHEKHDYLAVLLIGLLQTSILYIFFYIGLSNTTGVKAAIVTASGSFFLAISSHILFKNDNLTLRKILGLIIGFLGIIIINVNDKQNLYQFKLTGELFILIGAVSSTFANVIVKYTVAKIDPMLICAYQFTIGSVILFFISMLIGPPSNLPISMTTIMLLIVLSLISATAYSLWYLLIKHNNLTSIAVYRFLIPICGTSFSTIFIESERFTLRILISLIMVCIGMLFTSNKINKQ